MRGLVEGFYGTPWTWQQRLSVVPRLAELGFNAYLYGPKDDEFVCLNWRRPYNQPALDRLSGFREVCGRAGIDLICMLAPCFTMVFTSASDFNALMTKYAQLYELGFRRFVLLFDDVPEELHNEHDRAQYGSILAAHIDLALRVYESLKKMDSNAELIVCPTEYWGDGSRGYLAPFGQAMPEDVQILYTGYTICAHSLTLENAQHFRNLTGKKPLYWDNYPVNDANMTREFHIAPIINRDKNLFLYAKGLLVNPMEYMEASMLSLFTFGEYLNDPAGYEPEASFRRAVRHVLGDRYFEGASALRELCYRSVLTGHGEQFPEGNPLAQRHTAFLAMVEKGAWQELTSWATQRIKALEMMETCNNKTFLSDSKRWRESALCFLRAVAALDTDQLQDYLAHDPEDIMLYEAQRLIDRFQE